MVRSNPDAPELYEFENHRFTNSSQTGRTGPSLAQVQTAYSEES